MYRTHDNIHGYTQYDKIMLSYTEYMIKHAFEDITNKNYTCVCSGKIINHS